MEAELGKLAGVEDAVKVNTKTPPIRIRTRLWNLWNGPVWTPWPSPSAPATGLTSSKANRNWIFARLEKITNMLPGFPLVLHGASTVIPEFVAECNKYGGKLAGAQGCPEDMLKKAGTYGGLQDQHRYRPASGHDRFHPEVPV